MSYEKTNTIASKKEIDYNETSISHIIDRLEILCGRYNELSIELNNKLDAIKRFDDIPIGNDENLKCKQPDCAIDVINSKLFELSRLNDGLEHSLKHLSTII